MAASLAPGPLADIGDWAVLAVALDELSPIGSSCQCRSAISSLLHHLR